MASFHDSSTLNLRYQVGSGTDIGGGRENQDESFVWINKEANLIVLGVLDGHGREVGKIAAQAGKQRIVQYLDTDFSFLQTSPVQFLVHAHELAHEHIRATFQAELERQGYQVQLTEEGYLMKRRSTADYWSCVHGGTSCSLVALVGNALYIANVGDSTAIMCSSHPILQKNILHFEVDSAMPIHEGAPSSGSTIRDSALHDSTAPESPVSDARKVLVLTAEHSPESPYEFDRLRRYRPRDNDELQPALFVVYDSPNHDKSHCQPVFDPTTPTLQPSQRGRYELPFLIFICDFIFVFDNICFFTFVPILVIIKMCGRNGLRWYPRRSPPSFRMHWLSHDPLETCICTHMVCEHYS